MNELKKNPQSITFIDHHILITGELIDGQYPCALIDFPSYNFDKDSRILQGQLDFKINKNLIAIYGDGRSLSGAAGGGVSTRLFGIYKLPFTSQGYDTPQLEEQLKLVGLKPYQEVSYSRFFTEMLELAINFTYVKLLAKRSEAKVEKGQIAPQNISQVKSVEKTYRIYSLVYPIFLVLSKLDFLDRSQRGYAVIVAAKKE